MSTVRTWTLSTVTVSILSCWRRRRRRRRRRSRRRRRRRKEEEEEEEEEDQGLFKANAVN